MRICEGWRLSLAYSLNKLCKFVKCAKITHTTLFKLQIWRQLEMLCFFCRSEFGIFKFHVLHLHACIVFLFTKKYIHVFCNFLKHKNTFFMLLLCCRPVSKIPPKVPKHELCANARSRGAREVKASRKRSVATVRWCTCIGPEQQVEPEE
jgi:hypothetical protein